MSTRRAGRPSAPPTRPHAPRRGPANRNPPPRIQEVRRLEPQARSGPSTHVRVEAMTHRGMVAVLVLVLLAAGALGVKLAVDGQRPKGTDIQQIREMLRQGEAAAERGQASGIAKFI